MNGTKAQLAALGLEIDIYIGGNKYSSKVIKSPEVLAKESHVNMIWSEAYKRNEALTLQWRIDNAGIIDCLRLAIRLKINQSRWFYENGGEFEYDGVKYWAQAIPNAIKSDTGNLRERAWDIRPGTTGTSGAWLYLWRFHASELFAAQVYSSELK